MLTGAAPLLLGALLVTLMGLLAWGLYRDSENTGTPAVSARDDVLLSFMLFTAAALVVFLVYFTMMLAGR